MKHEIALALCLVVCAGPVVAKGGHSGSVHSATSGGSHAVSGHVTKRGTYVAPTRATNPDGRKSNNYSHKGNVNPYNGEKGTKN